MLDIYYPTALHNQDVTQGQFLTWYLTDLNPEFSLSLPMAQSDRDVEYTNYISLRLHPNKCPGYDKQSDALGDTEYPHHCHCYQVHSGPE